MKSREGTVTSDPAGIDCGDYCSMEVDGSVVLVLTATPSNGWVFAGWNGQCEGVAPCIPTLFIDTTIGATFACSGDSPGPCAPDGFRALHISRGGSPLDGDVVGSYDIDCGEICDAIIPYRAEVTLVAMPHSGLVFGGWFGLDGCGSEATCTFTIEHDTEALAVFK